MSDIEKVEFSWC